MKIWLWVKKPINQKIILIIFVIIVSALFITISFAEFKPAFPLDDSWIHQTYARNLVLEGRWEYIKGEISAGSTSPLWTILIAIGNLLGLPTPFLWTTLLLILVMASLIVVVYELSLLLKPGNYLFAFVSGFALSLEWHLLWSVGSGMETLLFCMVIILIFYLLKKDKIKWWLVGIITGLLIWIRPDGITILGPVFLVYSTRRGDIKNRTLSLLSTLIPIIFITALYGWFNFQFSGKPLPNTFYAKQFEYSILLSQPILIRVFRVFTILISGAGIFLVPGFLTEIVNGIQKRDIWKISAVLWIIGYGLLFALRLPVSYQHGRYLFPLLPPYFILGISGSFELLKPKDSASVLIKKLRTILIFSFFITAFTFVILAERAFVQDLKMVDQLMVQPSLWVKEHTPKSSIIAAHDIGALGYFSERHVVDMAGLINPEILPFIRNEEELFKFIENKGSNFLVIFRKWYRLTEKTGKLVSSFEYYYNDNLEVVEIRNLD
ncbi:MAG: hypothetical protein NTZ74_05850 [Chloroflexi bacterium]|nr:hypothetical protein [Chloroflexota bacterium]